jgi:hypothetical protein
LQCMGFGGQPKVQRSVQECSIESCFLHPVRPYQSPGEETQSEDSVNVALTSP